MPRSIRRKCATPRQVRRLACRTTSAKGLQYVPGDSHQLQPQDYPIGPSPSYDFTLPFSHQSTRDSHVTVGQFDQDFGSSHLGVNLALFAGGRDESRVPKKRAIDEHLSAHRLTGNGWGSAPHRLIQKLPTTTASNRILWPKR